VSAPFAAIPTSKLKNIVSLIKLFPVVCTHPLSNLIILSLLFALPHCLLLTSLWTMFLLSLPLPKLPPASIFPLPSTPCLVDQPAAPSVFQTNPLTAFCSCYACGFRDFMLCGAKTHVFHMCPQYEILGASAIFYKHLFAHKPMLRKWPQAPSKYTQPCSAPSEPHQSFVALPIANTPTCYQANVGVTPSIAASPTQSLPLGYSPVFFLPPQLPTLHPLTPTSNHPASSSKL
jgi:hypothetical protein